MKNAAYAPVNRGHLQSLVKLFKKRMSFGYPSPGVYFSGEWGGGRGSPNFYDWRAVSLCFKNGDCEIRSLDCISVLFNFSQ